MLKSPHLGRRPRQFSSTTRSSRLLDSFTCGLRGSNSAYEESPVASAEFDTYAGPSRTTYDEHTIHERLLIEATRRRELSPVSRLPSETLAHIFSLLATVQIPHCYKDDPERPRLGWILVTHVCRRWRQAALEDPTLWARISFEIRDAWTYTMIERSRDVPLVVSNQVERYRWHDRIIMPGLLGPGLLRKTRVLRLNLDTRKSPSLEFLAYPACRLETLDLFSVFGVMHLPDDLFARDAPFLRSVALDGFDRFIVPWSSTTLRNLTSLSVKPLVISSPSSFSSSSSSSTGDLPSKDDFFDGLAGMHRLESLTLSFPNKAPLSSQTIYPPIELPRLSRLSLEGPLSSCFALVDNLRFPLLTELAILGHGFTLARIAGSLLPLIARHSDPEAGAAPLRALSILGRADGEDNSTDGHLALKGWRSRSSTDLAGVVPRSAPSIELRVDLLPADQHRVLHVLADVCRLLHLDALQTLAVTMDRRRSALLPTWPALLFSAAHATLQHVSFSGAAAAGLLCAALDPSPSSSSSTSTSTGPHPRRGQQRPQHAAVPFPHVRSVGLREADFQASVPSRTALHSMLVNRADAGAPVAVVRVAPSPNHASLSSMMRLGPYHDASAFELAPRLARLVREVRPTATFDAFERSGCLRMGECNQDDGWWDRRARARSFAGRTRFQM